MVIFHTNLGDIHIEVDETNAPITAENFLAYVRDGFYDGVIFHRVISGFVVQGGGFDGDFNQKQTRAPIKNESSNGLEKQPRNGKKSSSWWIAALEQRWLGPSM